MGTAVQSVTLSVNVLLDPPPPVLWLPVDDSPNDAVTSLGLMSMDSRCRLSLCYPGSSAFHWLSDYSSFCRWCHHRGVFFSGAILRSKQSFRLFASFDVCAPWGPSAKGAYWRVREWVSLIKLPAAISVFLFSESSFFLVTSLKRRSADTPEDLFISTWKWCIAVQPRQPLRAVGGCFLWAPPGIYGVWATLIEFYCVAFHRWCKCVHFKNKRVGKKTRQQTR